MSEEGAFAKENPWVKFFFDDWLNDEDLQACSFAAQGLWMNLLALMRRGRPYGYLSDKRGGWTVDRIAARLEKSPAEVAALLAELERNHVFSRDDEGVMYSRRLVRDFRKRQKLSEWGSKGAESKKDNKPANSKGLAEAQARAEAEAQASAKNNKEASASSRARASDSDSDSDSEFISESKKEESQNLPVSETVRPPDNVTVMPPKSKLGAMFDIWFQGWSSIRGSNHKIPAARAWLSVVTDENAPCVFECTASYLNSLDNPAKGYNPENFLFDQCRDGFAARWPPSRASPGNDRKAAAMADFTEMRRRRYGSG